MRQHLSHAWLALKLGDAVKVPAHGQPQMLVDETPALAPLVIVYLGAKLDVSFGLRHPQLKLLHPHTTVLIHMFVQVL